VDGKFTRSCVHERTAQLSHRHRRHDQDLADRRLRYYWRTDSLDGNLRLRAVESHANADCNANGHSYRHSNCGSFGDAYSDRNSNGNGNCDCNSDSNAYTDSYAYCYSNTDAYADKD
jgi:hypothetical protein